MDKHVKSRKLLNEKNYFCTEDSVKIIKSRDRDNFVKKSFKKDFRIIFLGEKIGFKKELSKKTRTRQRCGWAGAMEKMGRGARPVQEEETR
jgi:hypothetical protein